MRLLGPLAIAGRTAPSRVLFGPHVTNLGDDDRRFTPRHTAYYAARARGGAGIVVTEGASVHASDWPYERAPLAERCADGWADVATACRAEGALVIASLDHAGGQGSSAYSQRELWAPSRTPEVNTREVPKWMEPDDIAAVVAGFGASAKLAIDAGCDGVEINAGQHSLVRQFLSGLTNQRSDDWGAQRTRFATEVIEAVRGSASDGIVGLRLSCDELAPWAGMTPQMAPAIAVELCRAGVDYLVVTRGAIFSSHMTRPDFHEPTGFNTDVCRWVRAALREAGLDVPVMLQGSVVDPDQAEWAIGDEVCDAVEMTRAQIADPDLVAKLRRHERTRIRPCIRCNQACQVRDARNPIVTCVVEPSAGHETRDPDWYTPSRHPRDVTVAGAGVAGLEAARVAALRGHRVRVVEQADAPGGVAALAGPGRPFVDWLVAECERLGVQIDLGSTWSGGEPVVQATGGRRGDATYEIEADATVLDVVDVRREASALPDTGAVVLLDPIGGPIAVALAEELGERAVLVTQDQIAGNELSRTGDLAPANVRLAQRGVRIERRSIVRAVRAGEVELEDRFSGERRTVACTAVVDCGFRLPTEPLPGATVQIGDCVAPRTILEAVLEARRAALAL
ncbi:MAG: mycofactocin system FadH/OYE family oxidoreductase 1 [Ilumatobacteraceae bacterium]